MTLAKFISPSCPESYHALILSSAPRLGVGPVKLERGGGVTDVDIEKEQVKKLSTFLDLPTVLTGAIASPNFAQIYIKNTTKG